MPAERLPIAAPGRSLFLLTVARVGYDGGRVAAERLADHVVTRSEHIPRIQEAQASAYHVLRELVDTPPGGCLTCMDWTAGSPASVAEA